MTTIDKTMTKQVMNRGANDILKATSKLTQVLRQFETLYKTKLPSCDGWTVEEWMSAMGVERFVSDKGVKGKYTPGTIKAGWHPLMLVDDRFNTFKNVTVKWLDADGKGHDVFSASEKGKATPKPLKVCKLVDIADNKFSVAIILKGLKQGKDFAAWDKKAADSVEAIRKIENFFIINAEGEFVPVPKEEIVY